METRIRRVNQIPQSVRTRHQQTGVALYLMLIFAILMSTQLTFTQINMQKNNHNVQRQQRLKFAKENLIALAINYADNYGPSGAGPGHLPCVNRKIPNGSRSMEGPDAPCIGKHFVIGRLPRTVGIEYRQRVLNYQPDQYDARNALWYIVSTDFVNNPFTKVNAESQANLSFDGLVEVVAIVLDAGEAIDMQTSFRPSTDYLAYLEIEHNDFDILQLENSNDRYTVITINDLLPLVSARVSANVAYWLIDYRNRHCSSEQTTKPCFPYSAALPDGECRSGLLEGWIAVDAGDCVDALFQEGAIEQVARWSHWFFRNRWFEHVRYKIDEDCLGPAAMGCKVISGTVLYEGQVRPLVTVAYVPDSGH